MNYDEARARAAAHIREGLAQPGGFTPVILDSETRQLRWGWLFFYNSDEYVRTGDIIYALAGNAPIVVSKDGDVYETGTARPLSEYLAEIEAKLSGAQPSS